MSLYTPFRLIMRSDLFNTICGPHFWNYDIDRMCKAVPPKMLDRVYYIVNSCCHWTKNCRRHYECVSKSYLHDPPATGSTPPSWKKPCKRDCDIPAAGSAPPSWKKTCKRDENIMRPWGVGVFEKLLERGFANFKLQGRGEEGINALEHRLAEIVAKLSAASTGEVGETSRR